MSRNENRERTSNTVDNDPVRGEPAKLATYDMIGSGLTVEDGRLEKYESRYMREIIKVTESRDKDTQYKMTM